MILAGDIGGTSTRLALFELEGCALRAFDIQRFPSQQFPGLVEIVAAFMKPRSAQVERACFGIAGPVRNGHVHTPNLPWEVDANALAATLGLRSVKLLNDLEANAYGIAALKPEDFVTLNPGAQYAVGNQAVISVGTGLGEAGLYWDGQSHHPFACEGGHVDFAPRNELEAELLVFLKKSTPRVSYERVLSGPGLHMLYEFLRDTGRGHESPEIALAMRSGDPSAVISRAAVEGRCALCTQTMDWFVSFYGAEAGNLALKIMATGGLFIGGGIAPKIIEKLKNGPFKQAFTDKGRMQTLLESIPVRVIMQETTALLGAARCAATAPC